MNFISCAGFVGFLFLGAVPASALEAPHLISASVTPNRTVELSWRNNDVGSAGYRIHRYILPDTVPVAIAATATPGITQYVDTAIRDYGGTYVYAVSATGAGAESAISNSLRVEVPRRVIFTTPTRVVTYDSVGRRNVISVQERSNSERGHRLYRKGPDGKEILVSDRPSPNPADLEDFTWTDSTGLRENTWYQYRVETYAGGDSSIAGDETFVFTYRLGGLIPDSAAFLRLEERVSSFPIQWSTWAMRDGDTILLTETGAPSGSYTVLDASDPGRPRFVGHRTGTPMLFGNAGLSAGSDLFFLTTGVNACPAQVATFHRLKYENGLFTETASKPLHSQSVCPRYITPHWITLVGSRLLFFWDVYRSLAISHLGIGDTGFTAYGTLPKYISSQRAGQWDGMAFFLAKKRAEDPVGTVVLQIVDLKQDAMPVYEAPGVPENFSLPGYVDGLLYRDSALTGRKHLIVDKEKKLVYAFSEGVMDIYRYSLTQYGSVSISGGPRRAVPEGPVRQAGSYRMVLREDTRLWLYSLSGRPVHSWRANPGAFRLDVPAALTAGVYILYWSSRSESGTARILIGSPGSGNAR